MRGFLTDELASAAKALCIEVDHVVAKFEVR
jgi:hypothetical protein